MDYYIINNNIIIKGDFLLKFKERIQNIILANNFSYIRLKIHETVKQIYPGDEKYLEAMSYAILGFTKSLKKFKANLNYDIKTFSTSYIESELKSVFELDNAIKYPKKLLKLRKVLNSIKEDRSEYSNSSYYDLLIEFTKNIKNIDGKIVGKVGDLYLYILGISNDTSQKEESNEDEIDEDENFDVFADKIADLCASSKNIDNRILKLSSELNAFDEGLDSIDRPLGEEEDSETMRDNLVDGSDITALDIYMGLSDLNMIRDREIKLTGDYEGKSNLNLTLFERLIAGSFLEKYFTIKEYRDLLIEYGKSTGEGDRYVRRFHMYLVLFNFPNKRELFLSNFSQIDGKDFDALNYEQVGDIFGFSRQYAKRLYGEIEKKFNESEAYKEIGIVYQKFDTKKLGHTKTFSWFENLTDEDLKNKDDLYWVQDLPWVKEEYQKFLIEDEKILKKLKNNR